MPVGSKGRAVLLVALVAGLLIRVALFWGTTNLGAEVMDEQHYTQLATNLGQGNGFAWGPGRPTSIRPPLYPALVAAVWAVSGPNNLQAVRFIQVLLALLTTALVYQLGNRLFDQRVACYAAAVFWLYPSLMFLDFMILTETLFTLLLVAFVLLSVRLVQEPRVGIALACGLSLGLAALTRSILWPLPLVLCPLLIVFVRRPFETRVLIAALVLAGYAVAVVPWAVRNTRLQGVTTIVDTMGGLNLQMGNYEDTPDDRMWAAVGLTDEKSWSAALWREHHGEQLTEGQQDHWAQTRALAYMRAHPGITLRRALIKFADFWGIEREFAAGVGEGIFAPPFWLGIVASLVIVLAFAGVALLGAAGMWLAPPDLRLHVLVLLPVVAITFIHTLVFGHSRYHLPLIPIFGVYAAALWVNRSRISIGRHRLALAGAAVSVLVFMTIWVRQIVLVDGDRIRALFHHAS